MVFDASWWEVVMAGMACDIATARQRLSFAVVLAVLLALVGWALLAAAGPAREWVALLWLISATGLVPMLSTSADRGGSVIDGFAVAGLVATGASALTVVLAPGIGGVLAAPFLPLLIAYTALLMTPGKDAPPPPDQHQITTGG